MEFREFGSFDDMMAAIEEGTQQAIARTTPEQAAITYGDYWMRDWEDFLIFGYIMTEEELYSSPAYNGVSKSEIEFEKNAAKHNYDRGYRFGRAYSVIVPEGELGDTHVSTMIPITKENFEEAKSVNFSIEEIARQEWFIELATRLATGQ